MIIKGKPFFSTFITHAVPIGYKTENKRCPFAFQKGIFYTSKGHLLHCKRASFTLLKTTCYFQFMNLYYNTYNVLFFHNKRVSYLLHSCKTIIKTTAFQFSCHSRHNFPHHNALVTKCLCEMLKVTATKNKNYVRV